MSHQQDRGEYEFEDLGDVSGSVLIEPHAGLHSHKKLNATGNITLSFVHLRPVEYNVKITDDSGTGLLTITFNATVQGLSLPTTIAIEGEMIVFNFDGDDLWRLA